MAKLGKIFENLIWIILFFISILLAVLSIISTFGFKEKYNVGCLAIVVFILMLGYLYKMSTIKGPLHNVLTSSWFRLLVTVMWAIASFTYIFVARLQPTGDPGLVFLGVRKLLFEGSNASWVAGEYLQRYPNNNMMALYVMGATRIFGDDVTFLLLQAVNVVLLITSCIGVQHIMYLLYPNRKREADIIYVVLLLFLPINLLVTYVYGTLIGLCLSVLAIWLMVSFFQGEGCYAKLVASAFLVSLASVFKMNYLIVLLAMLATWFLRAMETKKIKQCFLGMILIIGLYLAIAWIPNAVISKIADADTTKGMPTLAWIAMGLRWEDETQAAGTYDTWSDYNYHISGGDVDILNKKAKEVVKLRLRTLRKRPRYATRFFYSKINETWNDPTYESFELQKIENSNKDLTLVKSLMESKGTLNWQACFILKVVQILTWLGAILFLIFEKRKINYQQMIFGIIVIGGFIFHLFWEAGSRYVGVYVWLIMPYAILGINDEFNEITKRLDKHN